MPELTPYELELLAEASEFRGYTPRDQVPEPEQGPPGPASASEPPAQQLAQQAAPDETPPTDQ
ncbi:hypothetical protein [Streptomyces sp. NPDC093591]|uniref:hypothetical protein n=1 Tax=Streptomyces sp. NPDC093591 TaxID=3366044 RepID=UPI0037F4BD17